MLDMGMEDVLFTGVGFSSTPERRALLLALARADMQPWTEDQAASGWTDHMAEIMYGEDADALEARRCHCGDPLAVVSVPEMADLGASTRALCAYCVPLRCDAFPLDCRRTGAAHDA